MPGMTTLRARHPRKLRDDGPERSATVDRNGHDEGAVRTAAGGLTRIFLLRLAASVLMVLALGGLGPNWLPTAALAILVILAPPIVSVLIDASSGGIHGLRLLLRRRWFEVSRLAVALHWQPPCENSGSRSPRRRTASEKLSAIPSAPCSF